MAASWIESRSVAGLLATLLPLLYLEYLLYQYLWFEPEPSLSTRTHLRPVDDTAGGLRRGDEWARLWIHPFGFGRWSEAGRRAGLGLPPVAGEPAGPDPEEFL